VSDGRRVIGLLHPGEMGAALGTVLRARGFDVLWASSERSRETAARAAAAGLEDAGSVVDLIGRASIVLSVCPPHAALEVAASASGLDGIFVDANAISPASARAVGARVEAGGAAYVDGGIVGPPPTARRQTRLYLAGVDAPVVAACFEETPVEAVVLEGAAGAASALKMAYAGWTKGTTALLLACRAAARVEGVEDALLEEWATSLPELVERSRTASRSAASKGWRWAGEMDEIAATLAASGLPGGLHQACAEIFRRVPRVPGAAPDEATVELILTALLNQPPS
jgi:3-hydroxyisobutyrate dehydrogenase-like beta-hydroxyacid dehydrogenase